MAFVLAKLLGMEYVLGGQMSRVELYELQKFTVDISTRSLDLCWSNSQKVNEFVDNTLPRDFALLLREL